MDLRTDTQSTDNKKDHENHRTRYASGRERLVKVLKRGFARADVD